ncbi:MAG TPA: outer membrane beta-barrel protein [Bryobacteraceae bacterium]|nr:outer membrane beta-barrel protein [Bryobacteraceae bacterium]
MTRRFLFFLTFCVLPAVAPAQVAEFSFSGGVSRFGGATLATNPDYTLGDGVRIALRMTLNTWRFMGHEFGYGYAHSNVSSQGQSAGFSIHQGFYNFLVYGTPEGSRVRPFATGGVHFSSFVPPGGSVYYGVTKFGYNYGGGLKFRLSGPWGARIDFRQFRTGKPDFLATPTPPSGWLTQTEISAGVSFNL